MKVSLRQFLSPLHSWGSVGTSLARYLKQLGHEVHLCSTNGYDGFPKDLEENVKCRECTIDTERKQERCKIGYDYDLAISYTMLLHFQSYLSHSKKNRFGIWNYDGTEIPRGYAKYYKPCTKLLPSSKFSKDTFIRAGIPESAMVVIPHGYNEEFINRKDVYPIKTDRKRKVLVNIQQNHLRKNIPGVLDAWGRAFTNKDDVVMVAKVKLKQPKGQDISWTDEYMKMKNKYKNHAPIIVVNTFIDYMSDLYRACDIVFSASNVECFLLPSLEGIAANKLVIASNWGGNVDFMNQDNSLLINGRVGRAPKEMQYWGASVYGECFYPDVNHAAELLRKAVFEYDSLIEKFTPGIERTKQEYTWMNATKQMLELVE